MVTSLVAKTLVINERDEVLLLVRSGDDMIRPGDFDFPGGGVDEGEALHSAAVREIFEEAGLELGEDDLKLVFTHTEVNREKNTLRFLFAARLQADQPIRLSHEHSGCEWVRIDQVPARFPHPVWGAAVAYLLEHKVIESVLA